jgi:hypothetical protein
MNAKLPVLFLCGVVLVGALGCAKVKSTEVELNRVPGDVEYVILDETEGGVIDRIEYQVHPNQEVYVVTYTKDGLAKKMKVDSKGNLLE